ncbi:MAG: LptF/LptG family permease [Acidobacteria bacterium]|nr:LptF/LptG family permease [Acidobacteriota bacterium]MBK8150656.1 LptF/LptG family permease [Acidobacteriota bacterium]
MKKISWQISKYLLTNVGPYFLFSWLLLSVILFVQQASRFADIFFNINIPKGLIFQLTFALLPSVVAFTCPMAILVAVVIGLSKMQGDSELTAIRAAGVGNLQIALPIVVFGLILAGFAFLINLKGVPFASGIVRNIALRTALLKLESPIEPGVFNTEISGYTVYVREGEIEKGLWRNIFIHTEDKKTGQTRLITASSGRIDSTFNNGGEVAELVLDNASVITLPASIGGTEKVAAETLGALRFAIKTRRDEIVKRLTTSRETPEELGLGELAQLARSSEGKERVEAQILWQRRIILSISPLVFALLGTALVLRFNRGGRGFGIFLALVSLISYYLVTLLGEQLTRTGRIGAVFSGFLPILLSVLVIAWLFLSSRFMRNGLVARLSRLFSFKPAAKKETVARENVYLDLTTGIRDFDIAANLAKYFALTTTFLSLIYLIFTTFELWKFAGSIPDGIPLLLRYLLFLLPFLYLQLAPSALMIATLATFVIKSRSNEIVTWAAAGQSLYRLLAPCFVFMMLVGLFNWGVQEFVAPFTNQRQDELRSQIRNRGTSSVTDGKIWVATRSRIYSFETSGGGSTVDSVRNISIYQFRDDDHRTESVLRATKAEWANGEVILKQGTQIRLEGNTAVEEARAEMRVSESDNPFGNLSEKPNHMSSAQTSKRLASADAESEVRSLGVALNKKYSTPFLPLLIALFTAPFALSLNRRGKVLTVGLAVAVWLVYMAVASGFEQSALGGSLPPAVAVWIPLALFSALGIYLLTKVRT